MAGTAPKRASSRSAARAQPAAAPASVTVPVPVAAAPAPAPVVPAAGVLDQLAVAIRAAAERSDFTTHAVLSELQVAAGALKYKAAQGAPALTGADAELVARIKGLL